MHTTQVLSGYVITLAYLFFSTLIFVLKFEVKLHWAWISLIFFGIGERLAESLHVGIFCTGLIQ